MKLFLLRHGLTEANERRLCRTARRHAVFHKRTSAHGADA